MTKPKEGHERFPEEFSPGWWFGEFLEREDYRNYNLMLAWFVSGRIGPRSFGRMKPPQEQHDWQLEAALEALARIKYPTRANIERGIMQRIEWRRVNRRRDGKDPASPYLRDVSLQGLGNPHAQGEDEEPAWVRYFDDLQAGMYVMGDEAPDDPFNILFWTKAEVATEDWSDLRAMVRDTAERILTPEELLAWNAGAGTVREAANEAGMSKSAFSRFQRRAVTKMTEAFAPLAKMDSENREIADKEAGTRSSFTPQDCPNGCRKYYRAQTTPYQAVASVSLGITRHYHMARNEDGIDTPRYRCIAEVRRNDLKHAFRRASGDSRYREWQFELDRANAHLREVTSGQVPPAGWYLGPMYSSDERLVSKGA